MKQSAIETQALVGQGICDSFPLRCNVLCSLGGEGVEYFISLWWLLGIKPCHPWVRSVPLLLAMGASSGGFSVAAECQGFLERGCQLCQTFIPAGVSRAMAGAWERGSEAPGLTQVTPLVAEV